MSSKIRANKQTNRAGLGTVTYADTGIIVSGIVTCTELSGLTALNIAGVGTANTLDINGDIDVDGHTNLDNVNVSGITTFANNVHAANVFTSYLSSSSALVAPYADIDDYVDVGSNIKLGNAGIITATSFVGDGSNLTGITQTTINNNADNRVITGSGTANTLNAESTLTYDGTTFKVGQAGTGGALAVRGSANSTQASFSDNTSGTLRIATASGALNLLLVESGQSLVYGIGNNSGLSNEYLRITSAGKMGVGTDNPNRTLSVKSNGGQFSIIDDDDSKGQFYCNAGTVSIWATGGSSIAGALDFATTPSGGSTATRMQINSSGQVRIYNELYLTDGVPLYLGNSNDLSLFHQSGGTSVIRYNHTVGGLHFRNNSNADQMILNSSGHMGLGVTPNANWPTNADFKALQIGTGACVFGRGSGDEDRGGMAVNWYSTGSGDKYIGNGNAARVYLADGNMYFSNAAANSSGANAAMTLTDRLLITSTGRLKINHTSTTNKLDDTWLSIYDANSDSSANDPTGISKNYAMISLHNYGTGVPGDSTGIGFGAGASFGYTKGSIAFARSGSYGTGDLIFLTNNDQDATMVNDTDEKMRITRDDKVKITGVVETGPKTITGGTSLAIQNFAVKGVWSGSPSIGKSIELISGYDSAVKMAAIGYNLTDVNLGSTYGGDLTFHTQPLYGSPQTPIPERMRISSSGYITKSVVPSWNLRPSYNSTQTTANTSSHHAIGWSADSSGNGSTNSKATFLQNCTLHGSGFTYNLHNGQNVAALRVPVAGRYYVNCTYRVENNPNQGNIYVYLNSSQIARQHVEMWAHRPYMHCQWASVLNLAKNDEIMITISCPNANVSGRNDNVNWFSGYLIG